MVPLHNIVRDYDKSQGTTHATDLSYQIVRDYHVRHVSIENSAVSPIGVGITAYASGPTPDVRLVLQPGEIRHVAINSHGSNMQFLWILDLQTRRVAGEPYAFRTDANQFVIRDGLNKYWVHAFKSPSYSAAF